MEGSHPYSAELKNRKAKKIKRNEQEKARVHTVSNAFDKLRENIPINTDGQKKLSKIETLRLARNYIDALQTMLQTNEEPTPIEYANTLANGMSSKTTGVLAEMLQVQPHLLNPHSQLDASSDLTSSSQYALHCDHHGQQQSDLSHQALTYSRPPSQYLHDPHKPSAAPRQATIDWQQYHHM